MTVPLFSSTFNKKRNVTTLHKMRATSYLKKEGLSFN